MIGRLACWLCLPRAGEQLPVHWGRELGLQTQFEGVQQSPQLALTPGLTYPAARFSARAPLLVP